MPVPLVGWSKLFWLSFFFSAKHTSTSPGSLHFPYLHYRSKCRHQTSQPMGTLVHFFLVCHHYKQGVVQAWCSTPCWIPYITPNNRNILLDRLCHCWVWNQLKMFYGSCNVVFLEPESEYCPLVSFNLTCTGTCLQESGPVSSLTSELPIIYSFCWNAMFHHSFAVLYISFSHRLLYHTWLFLLAIYYGLPPNAQRCGAAPSDLLYTSSIFSNKNPICGIKLGTKPNCCWLIFNSLFVPHCRVKEGNWKYLLSICACCEHKLKNEWSTNFHFCVFVHFAASRHKKKLTIQKLGCRIKTQEGHQI